MHQHDRKQRQGLPVKEQKVELAPIFENLSYATKDQNEKIAFRRAKEIVGKAERNINWIRNKIIVEPQTKPGLIGYPKSELTPDQTRYGKPKTFIQFCAKHTNITVSQEELDKMAYAIGNSGVLMPITHRIVEGEELFEKYSVVGSCFLTEWRDGAPAKPLVRFYSENPDKIKLVVFSNNGNDIGRALLWYFDGGAIMLDRVYSNSSHAVSRYAEQVAKEEGWSLFSYHGAKAVVSDLKVTPQMPPYFDCFSKAKYSTDKKTISLTGDGGGTGFNYYNGRY